MPRAVAALILPAMLALVRPAAAQGPPSEDQARALADLAARQNPGLAASAARVRALEERVRRAGAWQDPIASIEYSNMPIDAWVPGHHAMSGIQLMLRQTFFFPGKLRLRTEVAEGQARQARLAVEEQELELRAMVAEVYYKLALTRQLRGVTVEHVRLVGQLIDAARIKYEVGRGDQQDLLRLELLRSRLEDDLNDFDRDEASLVAGLNAALHRDPQCPIPTPRQLGIVAPGEAAGALSTRAQRQRPLLRRYAEQARTERAAARAAAREAWPDLTSWFGYRVRTRADGDPGTDFVSLGLSLPLPLSAGRRWGTARRAAEQLAYSADAAGAAALDDLRGKLGEALARWQRAAQQARTYREKLVPEARRVLDATLSAYQVGRADFASLYQAQLELLNFARTILRAEAAAALGRVEVAALVGDRI